MKTNNYTSPEQAKINEAVNIVLLEIANEIAYQSSETAMNRTNCALVVCKRDTEIIQLLKSKMK